MTEKRTTIKDLKANIDETSFRFIPAGQIIAIGPEMSGMIRIWWTEHGQGIQGLLVTKDDLDACTET